MLSIGIGEIQKNTSVFANLTEAFQIVDKRKKQVLAMVYPIKKQSPIQNLAGKYKDKIESLSITLDQIKEQSIYKAMEEKYGLSS
jgi:hypothetical protein